MATNTDKIINPFKEQDIDFVDLPKEDTRYGSEVLGNLKELQIGSGQYGFYSDESGIWLGSKKFSTAPFSVDMYGNLKATVGTFSGDIDGATITGSTIIGSTLSTATSGQRVVLTSTLAEYYNSSGTKIAQTYASSNSFLIRGYRTTSAIWLDAGSSSSVAIGSGGDVAVYIDSGTYAGIYPYDGATSSSGYYCGNQSNNWYQVWTRQLYVDDQISLNGSTISRWSDIASAPTQSQIESILSDIGGMTGVTLRVQRVLSDGTPSGWYYLHFTYGLLDTATVN